MQTCAHCLTVFNIFYNAGTWFTCKNRNYCIYYPPLQPGSWNYTQDDIWDHFILNPNVQGSEPFGECYPCSAAYDKIHYDVPGNPTCTEDYVQKKIIYPSTGQLTVNINAQVNSASMCKSFVSSMIHKGRIYCPGCFECLF